MLADTLRRVNTGGVGTIFTDMPVTSTNSGVTRHPSQSKLARTVNDNLWALIWDGTSATTNAIEFWVSQDHGLTWDPANNLGLAQSSWTIDYGMDFFIDVDDYAHVIWRENFGATNAKIFYSRGTPNAGRTSYTWSTPFSTGTDSDGYDPTIIVHKEGTGYKVHIVYRRRPGGLSYLFYRRLNITSGGTVSIEVSGDQVAYAPDNTSIMRPVLDFKHNGDGRTKDGDPHLFLAWSQGYPNAADRGIRFKKGSYSGGAWSWSSEVQIDETRYDTGGQDSWLSGGFNGTDFVFGGLLLNTTPGNDLMLYTRNVANTVTTTKTVIAGAPYLSDTNSLRHGDFAIDSNNIVNFIGRDNVDVGSTRNLNLRRYNLDQDSLDDIVTLDPACVLIPDVTIRPQVSIGRLDFLYLKNASNPYTIRFGGIDV